MDRTQFSIGAETVLGYFYDISQIPRQSGNNRQISTYLLHFAQELGLKSHVDDSGNVIVEKAASPGLENGLPVILEAHYDMVCEKVPQSEHDFNGPLELRRDGEKIYAEGTSLGADNGLGVAAIMAVLAGNAQHPPLEAIFTSSEETDMSGAQGVDMSALNGELLLTLDSHALLSSGAGELDVDMLLPIRHAPIPDRWECIKLTLDGLRGGHSGANAMDEPGNAIILLNRYLNELKKEMDYALCDYSGGTQTSSAFARQASCVIAAEPPKLGQVQRLADSMAAQFGEELRGRCEKISIRIEPEHRWPQALSQDSTSRFLSFLTLLPDGVYTRNHQFPGAMESCCNCGVVSIGDQFVHANALVRTTCVSRQEQLLEKLRTLSNVMGAELTVRHVLPPWEPHVEEPVLRIAREIYGKDPELTPATLECGVFQSKKPSLSLLGVGIPYYYQHSPAEYALASEVTEYWEKLKQFLTALGKT